MITTNKKSLFALVTGLVIALTLVAGTTALALTASDIDLLVAMGIVSADKAAAAKAALVTTQYATLKIGSKGAEVTALQNMLISGGYLVMPAGVKTGYYGSLTASAFAKYQAAQVAAQVAAPVVTAPVVTTPGVTTNGQEGTLSVTSSSVGLVSTAYEGDTKAPVLAFKVEAQNSDLNVQRVKINFGLTATTIQNKIYKTLYVTDSSGNVLGSMDTSGAVKDSSNGDKYALTITGLNYVVKAGQTKTLVIKADVYSTVDSGKIGQYTLALSDKGVRAVDGAGIDQYDGGSTVSRSVNIQKELAASATLTLSTNSGTPNATSVVASDGSNSDEVDGIVLAKFNLQAKKDSVKVTDLTIKAATTTGTATIQTVYLYDGSDEIDSASLVAGAASFSNMDLMIDKDSTKTFTVKADFRDAKPTVTTWSVTGISDITAENSVGDSVNTSGSATGNNVSVTSAGPEFTLVSKSLGTKSVSDDGAGHSTSTQDYKFTIRVSAVGGAVTLGSSATGTTARAFGTATTTAINVYKGSSIQNSPSVTVAYFKPDAGVTESNNTYTIAEGQTADFDVIYSLTVATADQGSYAIGIKGINTDGSVSNYMDGLSAWRSAAVQLP